MLPLLEPGAVVSLAKKVTTRNGGLIATYELGKEAVINVLVIGPGKANEPFDLDVVMAKAGWVRKPL